MKQSREEKLAQTAARLGIEISQIPQNIAIIMDGNGRWAQNRGLPRFEGHRQGAKTVEKIVQHCVDLGLESLTIYSFSMQNWKRPKAEIDFLMNLYEQYLVHIRPLLMKNEVRLVHLGRTDMLPGGVVKALHDTVKLTADNGGLVLGLALNYGSRTEIIDAAKKIAQQYKNGELSLEQIDEEIFSKNLYTANLTDPDLLIRTSNEMRISNFLLWQLSYSEFYVTPKFWPEFDSADVEEAILAYSSRNRRFGGLDSQVNKT